MAVNARYTLSLSLAAAMMTAGVAQAANGVVTTKLPVGAAPQAIVSQTKGHANPLARPAAAQVKFATKALLYAPGSKAARDAPISRAFGSFGIPYTSTRVEHWPVLDVGGTARNLLSVSYPYSAIGRLSFKVGALNSHCSASLIMRSVIITAAHCVQDFGSPTLFTNFKFTPAFYGPPGATAAEKAPFGIWGIRSITRSTSWVDGTDPGSGSARNNDVAVSSSRRMAASSSATRPAG